MLIDGRFSPGEWQDALAVPIAPGDTLFLHQYRGHVFLGVRTARPYPTYVDLFLLDGEGTVHNLHASMQTGERVLTDTLWTDARPATRWGNERDWTANVSRPLPERRERVSPAPREHFFPQDGREFQLRRSRFPGRLWRLRVEVRDLGGSGAPDVVHPAGSARKDVSGWATLDLGRRGRGQGRRPSRRASPGRPAAKPFVALQGRSPAPWSRLAASPLELPAAAAILHRVGRRSGWHPPVGGRGTGTASPGPPSPAHMTRYDAVTPVPAPGGGPDPRAAEEQEFVRRAIRGDGAALEWLVTRFRPFALRVALRLVGDLPDAEDVCQDALATVVERIGECRQPECFVAWLLRIVRNQGISLLRRRAVRAAVPLDAAGKVPGREDPERDAELAELRGRLAEALHGLTRLQREVVVLFDLQGWPHAEVAARLGITEGSARVHLHNARRALRARLAAGGALERAA